MIDQQWNAKQAAEAKGRISPSVFHRNGNAILNFRTSWRAAVRSAGHPHLIPHDLRRTAVRNLVRAGVPEKTAQELTGHKTRSVFERYNIVTETDQRSAVRTLANATGTKKGQSARSGQILEIGSAS